MNDEFYMQRCLALAKQGEGHVAPNPLVGCVIVHKNKIIGEGYHQKYGSAHAEVNAINSVVEKSLLTESTLYVNLEPCSHYGKTPPCSDLIIKHKIPVVVIGAIDNNKLVAGKGIARMKDHGIQVRINVLKNLCLQLNKRFYTAHNEQRPYIILKWAETQDGFISRHSDNENFEDNWISCEQSKVLSHQLRATEQAILIGSNTAILDNPTLTTRLVSGKSPIRIVVCSDHSVLKNLTLIQDDYPTIIFNQKIDNTIRNKEYIKFDKTLKNILKQLVTKDIHSVIIEGGSNILNQFIEQNLWDEAIQIIGNKKFGDGVAAPSSFTYNSKRTFTSGGDLINHFHRCI